MQIVDLADEHVPTYLCCLEDWSEEMTEAGDLKRLWYDRMKDRGLRVKLAVDADQPVGMIQYLPIEHSIADGRDLYMVLCIWVHGYKGKGVGDHQGHGIGTALLEAAEEDARALGARGMAAWGITMPFWMRSSWFKRHGYLSADTANGSELVWKPFQADAEAPEWIPSGPAPEPVEGQVTLTGFVSGWCPSMNLTYERAKRVAHEVGPPVTFVSIDTTDHEDKVRVGQSDTVYLDGKAVQTGAPPSYETIKKKVEKRVRRLQRR
jgi:GNAT superfamily N-acetyltransferase